MPETRSGAGGAGPSHPVQAEVPVEEPEAPSMAEVLDHMKTIISGIEELRSEVEKVKATDESRRKELSHATVLLPPQENTAVSGSVQNPVLNQELTTEVHQEEVRKEDAVPMVPSLERIEYIPVSSAHKLYSRELEADRVSRIGDYRFPAARMTWRRIVQDFPVRPELLRRLVGVAFSGAAKKIYEEVSAANLSATADELWDIMETKLYNVSQQRSQRASFYSTIWKEKTESIEQYGARLATAAMTLPEDVSEEALLHRFIDGLPQRLKVQALLISGGFDEIVAKTALVSKASQRPVQSSELVREISERQGRYQSLPISERTCFQCNQKGHIARLCPNSKNEKENAGNGDRKEQKQINGGGAQPAQGSAPRTE
jgi:hypothetical protein